MASHELFRDHQRLCELYPAVADLAGELAFDPKIIAPGEKLVEIYPDLGILVVRDLFDQKAVADLFAEVRSRQEDFVTGNPKDELRKVIPYQKSDESIWVLADKIQEAIPPIDDCLVAYGFNNYSYSDVLPAVAHTDDGVQGPVLLLGDGEGWLEVAPVEETLARPDSGLWKDIEAWYDVRQRKFDLMCAEGLTEYVRYGGGDLVIADLRKRMHRGVSRCVRAADDNYHPRYSAVFFQRQFTPSPAKGTAMGVVGS